MTRRTRVRPDGRVRCLADAWWDRPTRLAPACYRDRLQAVCLRGPQPGECHRRGDEGRRG